MQNISTIAENPIPSVFCASSESCTFPIPANGDFSYDKGFGDVFTLSGTGSRKITRKQLNGIGRMATVALFLGQRGQNHWVKDDVEYGQWAIVKRRYGYLERIQVARTAGIIPEIDSSGISYCDNISMPLFFDIE